MTFRRDDLLFREQIITNCIMFVLCVALIPLDRLGVFPYISLLFILLIASTPFVHNEFITIDAFGAVCKKRGEVLWSYRWEDIVRLKKSSRYRMSSVEIVTEIVSNEGTPYEYSEHYFQLGRKARKAIKMYYAMADNTF